MADVYYKLDRNNLYYTNESKSGYTLRPDNATLSTSKYVIVELYNDKFELPANSAYLFIGATNTTFNDTDKWDTSTVHTMDYFFYNCRSLTSIDVSNWDTSNVVVMYSLFYNCSSLTSLNISSFNTSKVWYMEEMFMGCVNLEHIYVGSGWDTSLVTGSDYMFKNCTKLHNFNSEYVDKTYAFIDDGTNGGYLEALPWHKFIVYMKA